MRADRPASGALHIEAAALTHRGPVRARNEDCLAVNGWIAQENMSAARVFAQALGAPFVCVVADGMGGHPAGDVASRLAAECLAKMLAEVPEERVGATLRQVNTQFYAVMQRFPQCAGMGTVVAGLVARPRGVTVFNIGDSRAYRFAEGRLEQLSVDDSAEPEWEAGAFVPRSGMVTQSIGGAWEFMDIEPHLRAEPCRPGSIYLLCSDGLYDALAPEEIVALIGPDLAASANALFEAAMAAPARDNVSLALVRIGAGKPEAAQ
ncbi:MAG TPA: PP2C family serine/threonine-protein phosphatase [Burkholderiales bacterium]|nr:PP2C family serine/threonine-protein phosphatase [Burkholderiales bacterium]